MIIVFPKLKKSDQRFEEDGTRNLVLKFSSKCCSVFYGISTSYVVSSLQYFLHFFRVLLINIADEEKIAKNLCFS